MSAKSSFALALAVFGMHLFYQRIVAPFANGLGQLSAQIKRYAIGAVIKTAIVTLSYSVGLPLVMGIVDDASALLQLLHRATTEMR